MTRPVGRGGEVQVWIAFSGRVDLPWQRFLRPGFRHCFAALSDGRGWTVVDPLAGRMVVERLALDAGFDLPAFWRRAGFRVLGPFTPGPPRPRVLPLLAPFTCVTACLRLLGLQDRLILTPEALHRHLLHRLAESNRKKILTVPAPSP